MPNLLLKARLALELPEINRALDTLIEKLPAPVRPAAGHTITAGGKRLRPLLTVLTAKLFGCRDRKIYPLSCTLEMLHAATLMHDDVIDNAPTRRGKPAAHTLHGVTETILAGDALLAAANDFVASYGSPALCSIFSRATYETAAGEILELHAMHNVSLTAVWNFVTLGMDYNHIKDAIATWCMVVGLQGAQILILGDPALEGYLIYTDSNGEMKEWASPGFTLRR